MKKNNEGMSIMLAVVMTFSMVGLSIFILSYIKPFAEQTKSIENSVEAYYVAYSGIEKALFDNSSPVGGNIASYQAVTTRSTTTIVPASGEGDSDFDKDFNILKVGSPIELTYNKGANLPTSPGLLVKVPDIDSTKSDNLDSGGINNVINWTISGTKSSGEKVTLQADPASGLITKTQINTGNINLSSLQGIRSDGVTSNNTFRSFYNTILQPGQEVKVKFTVINRDLKSNSKNIPYLESRLNLGISVNDRFINIDSDGRVYGFEKNIKLRVPSETTSEAFDFTIFQ